MKEVTIIGGGLGGLTLGILLRQRNVPVRLIEAGHYPRHRVCGEFISGRGLRVLGDADLRPVVNAAGARPGETVAFANETRLFPPQALPEPARCVSRHTLDEGLAHLLAKLGGEITTGHRWTGVVGEGVVLSTGRRPASTAENEGWFGLKGHFTGVEANADLEMHFLPDAYVGICQLTGGVVNVCGLFRKQPGAAGGIEPRRRLQGPPGSPLHERLRSGQLIENTFTAVAGLNLRPARLDASDELRIGDALTMIPPVTGNGMSMALESAAMAAPPLADYAAGKASWEEACGVTARAERGAFEKRLRWAGWLQPALFRRPLRQWLLPMASNCPAIFRKLFALTR